MSPKDFIAALTPAAVASQAKTGIPASFTIAQAALESGWGKSAPGFNLFGIKADSSWRGDVQTLPTTEYIGGKPITVQARWRKYPTWQGSIDDHAAFLLKNPRYKPAFAFKDGQQFTRAVARAGYATDPAYAEKVIRVITAYNLDQLDPK